LAKSYVEFLNGVGDVAVLERDLVRVFEIRNAHVEHEVATLTQESTDLDARLTKFRSEPAPLTVLDSRKRDLMSDVAKFTEHNGKLVAHKQQLERKVAEKETDLAAKEAELAQSISRKKSLQNRLEEQDAQNIDAAQLSRDRRSAEDALRTAGGAREEAQKNVWERENKLNGLIDALEKRIAVYEGIKTRLRRYFHGGAAGGTSDALGNVLDDSEDEGMDLMGDNTTTSMSMRESFGMGLGLGLQHSDVTINIASLHQWVNTRRLSQGEALVPSGRESLMMSSSNSRLSEFGTTSREEGAAMVSASQVLGVDFRNVVKPALRRLRETLALRCREASAVLRDAEDELARMTERKNDHAEDVTALQAKIARLENQYKTEKEALQAELRQSEDDLRAIEEEMRVLRRDGVGVLQAAEANRAVKEEEYMRVHAQCDAESQQLNQAILQLLNDITEHTDFIRQVLGANA
jgi:SMC interacting uncharacterized protein involved in chromosome segregation